MTAFIESLQCYRLLEAGQLAEVTGRLRSRFPDRLGPGGLRHDLALAGTHPADPSQTAVAALANEQLKDEAKLMPVTDQDGKVVTNIKASVTPATVSR
jgi:hypothetical protein